MSDHRAFRRLTLGERVVYYVLLPITFVRMWIHNVNGILHVLDIIRFRPMPAGLLDRSHPWVTGIAPSGTTPIWWQNVVFRSPRAAFRAAHRQVPEADEAIVDRVGRFMSQLVARSVPVPEIPWGPKRRLPHGINYLHGAVHFSAGLLIFNDFKDALYHFTDPAFRREIRRFAHRERREILLLFRDRDYDTAEFAFFVAFLRLALPWFSNSNGPKTAVLWGNPSPYAVVNIITGHWKRDTYRLKRIPNSLALVRPPVPAGAYFTAPSYQGSRDHARWPEKLLAVQTYWRIRARGAKGGLFFVDRRALARISTHGGQPRAPRPIASVFPLNRDMRPARHACSTAR